MSEAEVLLLVLAAIYLIDCATWQRHDVVAFAQPWLKRWRIVHPGAQFGNANAGVLLGNPLPPLGALLVAQPLPVSLSPEGVYAHVSQNAHPTGWPEYPGEYFDWSQLTELDVVGANVLAGQRLLARTMSAQYARWLADALLELAACPMGDRPAAIEQFLVGMFSAERAAARVADFWQAARGVLVRGNLLLISIVAAIVAILRLEPVQRWWFLVLLLILLLLATAVVGFALAHRRLFPAARRQRLKQLLRLTVSPPALVRAADALGHDILVGIHPLAVAAVLVDRASFEAFAQRVLADLVHPCPPACPSELPAAQAAEAWHRQQLQAAAHGLISRCGFDVARLLAAPLPEVDSVRSYCPRCRTQFESESGQCESCGGIQLVQFARAA